MKVLLSYELHELHNTIKYSFVYFNFDFFNSTELRIEKQLYNLILKSLTRIVVPDDNQELLEDEPFFELNSVSGITEIFYY